jgi:streptogramin lyase
VSGPDGIDGPDGNVCSPTSTAGPSGITPAGVTTLFADPGIVTPTGIAAGPDGNLWFTMLFANAIGRITPAGVVTIFRDATISGPSGITPGPDGNLWFTNAFNNSIGRITPLGVVSRHVGTGGIFLPTSITTGADGGLWFTNRSNDSIGRIDPSSFVVDILTGTGIAAPQSIVSGPDGSLWFTNATGNSIGRLTVNPAKTGTVCNGPLTRCTVTTTTDPSIKNPYGLTVGPDANLWFTNRGGDSVGTISPTGVVSSYTGPGTVAPRGIAAGPRRQRQQLDRSVVPDRLRRGSPSPDGPAAHLDSHRHRRVEQQAQAGTPRHCPVAGVHGVPADAVVVTATEADPSFLTVYPWRHRAQRIEPQLRG